MVPIVRGPPSPAQVPKRLMACRYEPRYDVAVPSHHFVTEQRDYMEIARRHSRLYIVPDFAKFVCCWPQVCAWPSLCL